MARYRSLTASTKDPTKLQAEIEEYLISEGFKLEDAKAVWKKGFGLMLGPQFVSFTVSPEGLALEAWIKWAILPGVYLGEFDTHGFIGAIPRSLLRDRVKAIEGFAD